MERAIPQEVEAQKATFKQEKARLMKEVFQGFNRLNSNLEILNRNLDTVNAIGNQLNEPLKAWNELHEELETKPTAEKSDSSLDPFAPPSSYSTPRSMREEQRLG